MANSPVSRRSVEERIIRFMLLVLVVCAAVRLLLLEIASLIQFAYELFGAR